MTSDHKILVKYRRKGKPNKEFAKVREGIWQAEIKTSGSKSILGGKITVFQLNEKKGMLKLLQLKEDIQKYELDFSKENTFDIRDKELIQITKSGLDELFQERSIS